MSPKSVALPAVVSVTKSISLLSPLSFFPFAKTPLVLDAVPFPPSEVLVRSPKSEELPVDARF